MELCADEPEETQKDAVEDDPATENDAKPAEKATSSDIPAPRLSYPARHVARHLALWLVYGAPSESDVRSGAW